MISDRTGETQESSADATDGQGTASASAQLLVPAFATLTSLAASLVSALLTLTTWSQRLFLHAEIRGSGAARQYTHA